MPALSISQPLLFDGSMFARPCDGQRNVESRPAVVPVGADAALVVSLLSSSGFASVWPDSLTPATEFRFSLWEPQSRTLLYATRAVTADVDARSLSVSFAGSWTEPMRDALGKHMSRVFAAELDAFAKPGDSAPVFVVSFPVSVGNRMDAGGDTSPIDPLFRESDPVAMAALEAYRAASDAALADESARAKGAESAIQSALAAEITRASEAERRVADSVTQQESSIATEAMRAKSAEDKIEAALSAEKQRAEDAESGLGTRLSNAETAIGEAQADIAQNAAAIESAAKTAEDATRFAQSENTLRQEEIVELARHTGYDKNSLRKYNELCVEAVQGHSADVDFAPGLPFGNRFRLEFDFAFTDLSRSGGARLFGQYRYGGEGGGTIGFYYNSTGKLLFESGSGGASSQVTFATPPDTERHTLIVDGATHSAELYTDGKLVERVVTAVPNGEITQEWWDEDSTKICLFSTAVTNGKNSSFNSDAKIYGIKCWQDDELVQWWVPTLDTSDDTSNGSLTDFVAGTSVAVVPELAKIVGYPVTLISRLLIDESRIADNEDGVSALSKYRFILPTNTDADMALLMPDIAVYKIPELGASPRSARAFVSAFRENFLPLGPTQYCYIVEAGVPGSVVSGASTYQVKAISFPASWVWLNDVPDFDEIVDKTIHIACRLDCQTRKTTAYFLGAT